METKNIDDFMAGLEKAAMKKEISEFLNRPSMREARKTEVA